MFFQKSTQTRLGILGGGQLGRMIAAAAHEFGIKTHIFTDQKQAPALEVTPYHSIAAYDDLDALQRFAQQVDLITFEFENIPVQCLKLLEQQGTRFKPNIHSLAVSQDRLYEKSLMQQLKIPTTRFAAIDTYHALQKALETSTKALPSILKTRTLGYDGKGQVLIEHPDQAAHAWQYLKQAPAILESFVDFVQEVSIITARSGRGEIRHFPLVSNRHKNHILAETLVPAEVSAVVHKQAQGIATRLVEHLDLVGLLTVEFFLTADQQLIVNEIAPRPHNSGHWTQDFCDTSQFEQLVRAITNMPLGSIGYRKARMFNLLGQDLEQLEQFIADPGAKIHLYGKTEVKPGRKMGHVNLPA